MNKREIAQSIAETYNDNVQKHSDVMTKTEDAEDKRCIRKRLWRFMNIVQITLPSYSS